MGTLINAVGVIVGGVIGILIGHRINKNIQDAVLKAAGLAVLFLGIVGVSEKALSINGDTLAAKGSVVLIVSLVVGTLVGEIINIERGFERFGAYLKRVTKSEKDAKFIDAFITASLTICIGAMAIIGSIQDGLFGDYSILMAKAILDMIIILILTSLKGRDAIFSVVPLVVLQGGITLLARFIEPIMTQTALNNLSLVGSVLIFCVGVNLVWDKHLRIANMLPAIIIAIIFAFLPI